MTGRGTVGRSFFAVVVTLCATVGGAIGATVAPAPGATYRAAATVVPHREIPVGDQARHLRAVAAALRLEPVLAHVGAIVKTPDVQRHLDVRLETTLRVLVVSAVAGDPVSARLRADAAALVSSLYVESLEGARRGRVAVGSFERGFDAWTAAAPVFVAPPERLTRVGRDARFGAYALRARCRGRSGCGPWVRLYHPFRAGVGYELSAWTRASGSGVRLAAFIGAVREDAAQSLQIVQTPQWQRISVRWTPRRDRDSAEIAIITARSGSARFDVDGVTLAESRAGSAPGVTDAFFAAYPRTHPVPAVVTESRIRGAKVVGAVIGSIAGLAAGFVGVVVGRGAQRREQREAQ